METEMSKKILDNDLFIQKNLGKLVKQYPHQKLIISNGKIFFGENALKTAREEFPNIIPMFFPVPGPEEFNHIL